MEILIGILIFGIVVALCRLWIGDAANSTQQPSSAQGGASNALFSRPANTWLFDQAAQDPTDSGSAANIANSQSSDSTSAQSCSPDFSGDNSGGDCPCPADSTSYDSGGCSVDSSSFDSGSSN